MFKILSSFLMIYLVTCCVIPRQHLLQQYRNNAAVKRLQEYIQIDTSGLKNVENVVSFWKRQAEELGLPFAVYRPAGLPICVITLRGRRPELPSIVLNSHSDVVPADADLWTYPPFSAYIDENAHMYGRGTQDTKAVSIQYLEAIRKLLRSNIILQRTVHIIIIPDEETGSFRGWQPFLKTNEFKSLKVGFVLDEGITSSNDVIFAAYQDKRPWRKLDLVKLLIDKVKAHFRDMDITDKTIEMKFNIRGSGGHGSTFKNNSVVEQVQNLINTAMEYRKEQEAIQAQGSPSDNGAYSSLNINIIEGGIASNVIPSRMSVVIDVRLAVNQKVSSFQTMINSWLAKLQPGSTLEFLRRIDSSVPTSVDDTNRYWVALRETIKNLGITMNPVVISATSDMVYLREIGIPAIGFSTRTNMINRIHDVDEYIPLDNFLHGIDIYVPLIINLANLPEK